MPLKPALAKLPTSIVVLVLLLGYCKAETWSDEQGTQKAIEVVSVTGDDVYLNIRNVLTAPIGIWVCDTPHRLSEFGYEIQWFTPDREWKRAKPRGRLVSKELFPKLLQIDVGQSVRLQVPLSSSFVIAHGMTLRILIRIRTFESSFGVGVPGMADQKESLRLISAPFAFVADKGTDAKRPNVER